MKLLSWLGWLLLILTSAVIGALAGAVLGAVGGPAKVLSWMNEDVSTTTSSTDSI